MKNNLYKIKTKITNLLDNSRVLFYCSLGILLVSFSVLLLAMRAEHRSNDNFHRTAAQQVPLRPGHKINMGSATMTVGSINYNNGSGHFAAPNDRHYLILNLTVKNYGEKPIHVLPSSDTYIKDTEGNVTYLTPYAVEHPFRAGELSPGEQITGQLSFLVPKTAKLTFYIDSIWSGGVIPIAIK